MKSPELDIVGPTPGCAMSVARGRKTGIRRFVRAATAALVTGVFLPAGVASAVAPSTPQSSGACAAPARPLGYSDALNKIAIDGVRVGGLSSLAFDGTTDTWASTVDNNRDDPSRVWFFNDLANPRLVRNPLVLKKPDGTPYTGRTADYEGLAVLPDGRFVASSESEPSIRIFDRSGVQQSELSVPDRFAVAPVGESTPNATLEGLALTPSGRRLVATMEGTLSGDTGDGTYRRFLVYDEESDGAWHLTKQIGYRVEVGKRVAAVAAYSEMSLLVMEAGYTSAAGNTTQLYAVTGLDRAHDVSAERNLAVSGSVMSKSLVADVTLFPSLGAPALQAQQTNPLMDNYEGMAITRPMVNGRVGIALISDDNFSARQITRVLELEACLP
jgi:hypothetical protein